MYTQEITALVNEINEKLKVTETDYGYVKAEMSEKDAVKVVYGAAKKLVMAESQDHQRVVRKLHSVLTALSVKELNATCKEFEAAMEFSNESVQPGFYDELDDEIRGYVSKYYYACNLIKGEEYHVRDGGFVVVDGNLGTVIRSYGSPTAIHTLVHEINQSQYYAAIRIMSAEKH